MNLFGRRPGLWRRPLIALTVFHALMGSAIITLHLGPVGRTPGRTPGTRFCEHVLRSTKPRKASAADQGPPHWAARTEQLFLLAPLDSGKSQSAKRRG